MTTTTTTTAPAPTSVRRTESQPLPALTTADRVALSLGVQLILRAEQHRARRADRAARTEASRAARVAVSAAAQTATTFEHRAWSGPTW